ncbi:glycosyltransferase family 2 protein [Thiomicrospira sp. ALE5]|uniref:glycosyltransferase family 2 protein n=1 Tax=Thiomicrospira sp. ALE5 TaxID=748650 RepID=UPI0008DF77B8|nr:glycosyltransferase family 2 protein [Thiomicrospira sp. ALE5]SFR49320.1 Glycosyl transferase family 2 [Thiomicrospira sp. ALE5]
MSFVSIITPSHNSVQFISVTIQSVLDQSFSDWELIIVDDCSTDNSVEVIQSFVEQDSRIKLIRLSENSGAAVARNTAIEAAQGRYIAFLDSDDLWLPDKLEKQLAFMQANDYPFSYAAYDKIDENGQVFGHIGVPDRVCYSDLLKTCSIGCLTAIYDTQYFGKVSMPLIRKRQDLGLWLKLLKKTDYAYGLNQTLAQYRVRTDSISANKANAAKFTWRLYREVEGLNLIKASYYFSHYAVRGLLRTKAPGLARRLGVLK